MEPVFELDFTLPAAGSGTILDALHGQLRSAILDSRLKAGSRLPPTRALAARLGVSRSTVVVVYDRLLAEGYVVARQGAGTRVAPTPAPRPSVAVPVVTAVTAEPDGRLAPSWRTTIDATATRYPPPTHDFRLGVPDVHRFPFDAWRRLQTRAVRDLARRAASYDPAEGRPALREAIAGHVSFTRAVACQSDDVIVTAGAQQAFDLLARVFVDRGRTHVAFEDPGYVPARATFAAAGAVMLPVPIDDEGLVVERIPDATRIVMVTPSHQFPVGVAMSPRRRRALLAFAASHRAIVVEDDYDGEFRFGGRPVEALQTLDRAASVFYVGTFSKSMLPALRIGFVVAPAWARPALVRAKELSDGFSPSTAQDALAAFIAEGHLARHIRVMRRVYGERRSVLERALVERCAPWLSPIPAVAGLHVSARLAAPLRDTAVTAALAAHGLKIEALSRHAVVDGPWNGLAFGVGAIATDHVVAAVDLIASTLRTLTR